jgi:signal transduction histidine kinase
MENLIYIGILGLLVLCVAWILIVFTRTMKQKQQLHETIIRSQNEKEIETYSRIAGEYLHQQVINGQILPHLIRLKALETFVKESPKVKNKEILDKIQILMVEMKQMENVVRHMSENIFPPHLTYFFTETCQKRLDELAQSYPNEAPITFHSEGTFNDLVQSPTMLYNLYSLMDLFVTNSLRHAQARQITVSLKRHANQIGLEMSDNGNGFLMEQVLPNTRGRGLADLRGRALILSAHYSFTSELGVGTQFKIVIPI